MIALADFLARSNEVICHRRILSLPAPTGSLSFSLCERARLPIPHIELSPVPWPRPSILLCLKRAHMLIHAFPKLLPHRFI